MLEAVLHAPDRFQSKDRGHHAGKAESYVNDEAAADCEHDGTKWMQGFAAFLQNAEHDTIACCRTLRTRCCPCLRSAFIVTQIDLASTNA